MEQFSLEKYLENPQRKVVTRDGREVDIYYSPTSRIPLIGATTSDNEIHQYTKDGFQCDTFNQAKNDLFFADEEEELTELQETLEEDCDFYVSLYNDGKTREELIEWIKGWCPRIIDLARKEIEKDNVIIDKDRYLKICDQYYNNGKENALKDLPKWKKFSEEYEELDSQAILFEDNERVVFTEYLEKGDYYIELSDLKNLPKEE